MRAAAEPTESGPRSKPRSRAGCPAATSRHLGPRPSPQGAALRCPAGTAIAALWASGHQAWSYADLPGARSCLSFT